MKKQTILLVVILLFISVGYSQDIYEACRKGNIELIKKLAKINPDTINKLNKSGYSPLIIAGYRNQLEAVKVLLELGAQVNAISGDGSVLTAGCYKSDTELVKILLKHKADVNVRNSAGTTPLMFAILSGNEGIVKLLLQNGADTNAKDNSGKTIKEFTQNCDNEAIKKMIMEK